MFFKYFFPSKAIVNKSNTFTLSGTNNFCNFKTSQNAKYCVPFLRQGEHDIQIFNCTIFLTKKLIPLGSMEQNISIHQIYKNQSIRFAKGFPQAFWGRLTAGSVFFSSLDQRLIQIHRCRVGRLFLDGLGRKPRPPFRGFLMVSICFQLMVQRNFSDQQTFLTWSGW